MLNQQNYGGKCKRAIDTYNIGTYVQFQLKAIHRVLGRTNTRISYYHYFSTKNIENK